LSKEKAKKLRAAAAIKAQEAVREAQQGPQTTTVRAGDKKPDTQQFFNQQARNAQVGLAPGMAGKDAIATALLFNKAKVDHKKVELTHEQKTGTWAKTGQSTSGFDKVGPNGTNGRSTRDVWMFTPGKAKPVNNTVYVDRYRDTPAAAPAAPPPSAPPPAAAPAGPAPAPAPAPPQESQGPPARSPTGGGSSTAGDFSPIAAGRSVAAGVTAASNSQNTVASNSNVIGSSSSQTTGNATGSGNNFVNYAGWNNKNYGTMNNDTSIAAGSSSSSSNNNSRSGWDKYMPSSQAKASSSFTTSGQRLAGSALAGLGI
jgi:hypothetical protein